MTIAISSLPIELQNFVQESVAKGEYPDAEHLMPSASYQLKEQYEAKEEAFEVGKAWKDELDKRIAEIENGTANLIPGGEVFARIDKLIVKNRIHNAR